MPLVLIFVAKYQFAPSIFFPSQFGPYFGNLISM